MMRSGCWRILRMFFALDRRGVALTSRGMFEAYPIGPLSWPWVNNNNHTVGKTSGHASYLRGSFRYVAIWKSSSDVVAGYIAPIFPGGLSRPARSSFSNRRDRSGWKKIAPRELDQAERSSNDVLKTALMCIVDSWIGWNWDEGGGKKLAAKTTFWRKKGQENESLNMVENNWIFCWNRSDWSIVGLLAWLKAGCTEWFYNFHRSSLVWCWINPLRSVCSVQRER